jgi:hypothetical protein
VKQFTQPSKKKDQRTMQVEGMSVQMAQGTQQEVPGKCMGFLDLYRIGSAPNRVVIAVHLNGIPLKMELDTGAKSSVIDACVCKQYFADQKLKPSSLLHLS